MDYRMDYRKLVLGIFAAMLGGLFAHQASAQWGTGGSTLVSRKNHLLGLDLFCDLSAKAFGGDSILVADQLKITTVPSEAGGNETATPSLRYEGDVFCAELEPGAPRSLNNAAVRNGVTLVGRFTLLQPDPKLTPQSGLQYEKNENIRTWTFQVPATPEYPFPELLYHLVPANSATAQKFCHSGVNDCKALIGLQLPAAQADYPARDIDGNGSVDLTLGQVFKFTTIVTGITEAAGNFYWGPCHSGAFGTPQTVVVDAQTNFSHGGVGSPVNGFSFASGDRIAVTVNQNDLWQSGATLLDWSNADGLTGAFNPVTGDESGANAPIGSISFLSADAQHRLWKFIESTGQWERVSEAAVGTLVGTINNDNRNFYIFGTAFDGPAPSFRGKNGTLKLYSWDETTGNTQNLQVTVATESIQCQVDTVPTTASGDARGERRVVSEGFPRLNIATGTQDGSFPFAVLGCDQPGVEITFADDGSPISLNPMRVLVNNKPVAIDSFQVVDTVSRDICDGGAKLKDLNLKLNRQQFIQAIAPGGVCQNGLLQYSVALGNPDHGWFGGQDVVDVNNCIQP